MLIDPLEMLGQRRSWDCWYETPRDHVHIEVIGISIYSIKEDILVSAANLRSLST